MDLHQNFIDGRFEGAQGAERIPVLNPARDTVISEIPDTASAAVDQAVAAAKKAQGAWEKLPAIQRAGHLRQISAKIRENVEPIARVIAEEQGKILDLARVEAVFTADYIDYISGIGGADGKHGVYEHTQTHVAYIPYDAGHRPERDGIEA
jgi:lactaldehyde dehydrogenase/glycolaldehyde dehydrogenase